jgi:hypothetical protein
MDQLSPSFCALVSASAVAQPASIQDGALQDWTRLQHTMIKIADAGDAGDGRNDEIRPLDESAVLTRAAFGIQMEHVYALSDCSITRHKSPS